MEMKLEGSPKLRRKKGPGFCAVHATGVMREKETLRRNGGKFLTAYEKIDCLYVRRTISNNANMLPIVTSKLLTLSKQFKELNDMYSIEKMMPAAKLYAEVFAF